MKKNRLTLGLIIPHYQNMFSTFYTLEIIKEVSRAAIAQDVDLWVETSWRTLRNTAGILFADFMGNERWIKKAKEKKIPYLILNYYNPASKDNCIGIDNRKASQEAVNYLIRQGHKRIAVVTGKLNAQAGRDRLEGFKKALKSAKINLDKSYIVKGDWLQESGRDAMRRLLALKELPTAVFVCGDEMAIGAMGAVKEAGLKVADDISFVGFDNMPQAAFPQNSLTTVEQPFSELANLGVKYLIQIIRKKPKKPIKIILKTIKLINRTSVKNLKGHFSD
jgi:LacI family transcriptional regulator